MEIILTVSVASIALCMLAIMIAVLVGIWRVRRVAMKAGEILEAVKLQIAPAIHDLTLISAEVRKVAQRIGGATAKIDDSVEALRQTAFDIRGFEMRLRERIEHPVMKVLSFVPGIRRGVLAFWHTMRKR